jgi:ABC-type transport system involved in cytochrome c biogenesis permease subunit
MGLIELTFYIITLALLALLSAGLLARLAFIKKQQRLLGLLAVSSLTVMIAIRWYATGHPPILGTFEQALSGTWAVMVALLIIDTRGSFSRLIVPFALVMLLYGLVFDVARRPIIISEDSLWVYFHVLFAWIAFGIYTVCLAAAVNVLRRKDDPALVAPLSPDDARPLPSSERLTRWLLGEGLVYGFVAQSIFYGLGSYYSSKLHGDWWIWDPVEFLFGVAWLVYAVAVHGTFFFKWPLRQVSIWVIVGFGCNMLLYWGLVLIPWATYHIFDPEIKIHFFVQ